MSLADLQGCLARLYCDESFRLLFNADARLALRRYELSERERRTVEQIDAIALNRFAGVLKGKRKRLFESCYPLLFRVAAPAVERYYDRYYDTFGSKPYVSVSERVADFGRFMEHVLRGAPGVVPYAADVALYERLTLAAGASEDASGRLTEGRAARRVDLHACLTVRPGIQVGTFEHEVAGLIADLANDRLSGDRPRGTHCYVFERLPGRSECRLLEVTPSAGALLNLCDGTRRVVDVVNEAGRGRLASMTATDILHALQQFVVLALLSSGPGDPAGRGTAADVVSS